jgi:hypothetical protein
VVDWVGQIRALLRQRCHDEFSLEIHWRGAGTAEALRKARALGQPNT